MAKSKRYFGDYTISGVFGGKPSARSRKATKDDFTQFGGIMLPAIGLIAYLIYKQGEKSKALVQSGTMSLTDKPIILAKK